MDVTFVINADTELDSPNQVTESAWGGSLSWIQVTELEETEPSLRAFQWPCVI